MPVVGYRVGGLAESVLDGETGVLFEPQSEEALARAIERFETLALSDAALRENARRFGRERFRAQMAGVIEQAARERVG